MGQLLYENFIPPFHIHLCSGQDIISKILGSQGWHYRLMAFAEGAALENLEICTWEPLLRNRLYCSRTPPLCLSTRILMSKMYQRNS